MHSLGLYQDSEASTNPAQRAGGEASGIHRRYPGDGGDRETGKRPHPGPDPPSGKPGLHCPSRENCCHSISGNRVPGSASQFQHHGVATPRSEDKEAETTKLLKTETPPSAREVSRLLGKLN